MNLEWMMIESRKNVEQGRTNEELMPNQWRMNEERRY